MPELRLMPLDEFLNKVQLKSVLRQLRELGVEELPEGDDEELDLDGMLTEELLADFMDRLEAHDLPCNVFLPVEFEGLAKVGEYAIGSAHALLEALDELREELDLGEEEEEEEEEEKELDVIEEQLRYAWRTFHRAASACIQKQVPLYILP